MKKLILTYFFLIAFTLTVQANGVRILIEYDEPTTNTDNTPLTDLAKMSVYFDIVGDIYPAKKLIDIPATSLNGGGHVKRNVVVPLTKNVIKDIDFWVTAIDVDNNESNKSNVIRKFLGYVNY